MSHFNKLWFCLFVIWVSPFKVSAKIIPGTRIVGGQEATLGQFPWEALLYAQKTNTIQCAGTIINEEWILTSANCLDGASSVRVVTGIVDSQDNSSTESTSAEIVVHEMYDPESVSNDIGLVRLEAPLDFDDNTQAIPLAQAPILAAEDVVVSGWGVTSPSSTVPNHMLHFAHLTTIDRGVCDQIFGEGMLAEEVLCARSPASVPRSPCDGDSGSPLVSQFNTEPTLVGVFVFISDAGCEGPYPSGYMSVPFYIQWIEEHIRPPPK